MRQRTALERAMTSPEAGTAWLLVALDPDDRQHAGNIGYPDQVDKFYLYDSFVPNWRNISKGHVAVVRGPDLVGIAVISNVTYEEGQKTFRRCPQCKLRARAETTCA